VKEELQRAEKEALTKKLNKSLIQRKEGANLAMQFLSNVYVKEDQAGDLTRIKEEELIRAEVGKEEMKTPIEDDENPLILLEAETDDFFEQTRGWTPTSISMHITRERET